MYNKLKSIIIISEYLRVGKSPQTPAKFNVFVY